MKATALGPGPVVVEDGGGRQAVQLAGQLLLLLPMLLAAAAGLGQLDAAAELLSRRLQRGGAGGSLLSASQVQNVVQNNVLHSKLHDSRRLHESQEGLEGNLWRGTDAC